MTPHFSLKESSLWIASFVSQSVEWLFNVIDGSDFRVKTDSSLTAKISAHLSLKLDYVVSHVNRPPPNTVADDITTSISLSLHY